jgi:hypothetical protein
MLVMPSNNSAWFCHALARETGRLGHLYSPGGQRGPWPWFPYALDNGAFSCWNQATNVFDADKWERILPAWHKMMMWSQVAHTRPLWAIVPDVIGDAEATLRQWSEYAKIVQDYRAPLALAVQDGMTASDVRNLSIQPEVIAIGGSDEFKWGTVEMWAGEFSRVHLLRCNSPSKIYDLEAMGIESCDGTGWMRGDRKRLALLEKWARSRGEASTFNLTPYYTARSEPKEQETFI